jgi:hypothetical protein
MAETLTPVEEQSQSLTTAFNDGRTEKYHPLKIDRLFLEKMHRPCVHLQLYIEYVWRAIILLGCTIHTGSVDHGYQYKQTNIRVFFVQIAECRDSERTPNEMLSLQLAVDVPGNDAHIVQLFHVCGKWRDVALHHVTTSELLGCKSFGWRLQFRHLTTTDWIFAPVCCKRFAYWNV